MVTLETSNTVTLTATSTVSGYQRPHRRQPGGGFLRRQCPGRDECQHGLPRHRGAPFTVTITAEDRYGNTVSGYNGPVTLTSSDGQTILGLPASITLSNGSATVTVTLDKANNVTLTASAGSVQGTSSAITVSPAATASFTVSAPSTAGAGARFTVTLTAMDPYGNVVTNYSGRSDPDQQRRPVGHGAASHAGVEQWHVYRVPSRSIIQPQPHHAHGNRGQRDG